MWLDKLSDLVHNLRECIGRDWGPAHVQNMIFECLLKIEGGWQRAIERA